LNISLLLFSFGKKIFIVLPVILVAVPPKALPSFQAYKKSPKVIVKTS